MYKRQDSSSAQENDILDVPTETGNSDEAPINLSPDEVEKPDVSTVKVPIKKSGDKPAENLTVRPHAVTTPAVDSLKPQTGAPLSSTQKTINLLKKYNKFSDGTSVNFEKGSYLICLFSMSCSHCQETYKSMCELNDQMPKTYLINFGREAEQKYFFNQGGNCKYPHKLIGDIGEFKRLLEGKTYPRILYFKDGEIKKDWDVDSYSREKFMKYFGMKDAPKKQDDGGLQLQPGGSPW